jgi:hypothetical protein
MPQTPQADAQAPAAATPAPGQPVATQAPTAPVGPISNEQADFLRTRRSALSNQLESAQERRDEVAEQLRSNEIQASERPGLQKRLEVLDERLVSIEREIALNGQALANAPARGRESNTTQPARDPGSTFLGRANPNLLTICGFALLMPLAIQFARRLFGPNSARFDRQSKADAAALRNRMDQMDSAIEAVAIEVERIGEGQRFLTQAMTEGGARAPLDPAHVARVGGFEAVRVREQESAERR